LNVYIPTIIGSIIKGEAFDDPKPHRFGMLSQPTSDPSTYQSKEELIAEFTNGHLAIAELLGNEDDRVFEKTVSTATLAGSDAHCRNRTSLSNV
jgi:hypothetical protein